LIYDAVDWRLSSLMVDKHRIKRKMMELMIGPDGAAINA
jgi:hypothetical protein